MTLLLKAGIYLTRDVYMFAEDSLTKAKYSIHVLQLEREKEIPDRTPYDTLPYLKKKTTFPFSLLFFAFLPGLFFPSLFPPSLPVWLEHYPDSIVKSPNTKEHRMYVVGTPPAPPMVLTWRSTPEPRLCEVFLQNKSQQGTSSTFFGDGHDRNKPTHTRGSRQEEARRQRHS